MLNKDYIFYTHSDPEIDTISDFLNLGGGNNTSIVNGWNSKSDFLNYKVSDLSNKQRIISKYSINDLISIAKENGYSEDEYIDLGWLEFSSYLDSKGVFKDLELLKFNTILALPKDKLFREIIAVSGKNQLVEYKNFNFFLSDNLEKLVKDPNYRPTTKYSAKTNFTVNKILPRITVWIWVRALNKVVDVSDFVEGVNMSVGKAGGNFSINLAPITYDDVSIYSGGYASKVIIDTINTKNKGIFYFHKLISTNDMVFIKFEELENEKSRVHTSPLQSIPSLDKNNIYDMIGLVDSNSQTTLFNNNDITINIKGRDLIKTIIEDGTYFYTLTLSSAFFLNSNDNNIINRLTTSGKYEILLVKSFRSIKTSLEFVINQLSNMGVVPDDLFVAYGDDRSKRYRIDGDTSYKEELMKGVWQIIKIFIDESVSNRRLVDDSISTPDGSLINHIWKLCQEPFVEFFADTYGSFYNFIIRQPPFTGEAIKNFLNSTKNGSGDPIIIDIEENDVLTEDLSYNEDGIYSWYEIIPQGNINGTGIRTIGDTIPAIYFPAYGNVWGSRRLSIVSNYIPYYNFTGVEKENNDKYFLEQLLNDYKFIIDINAYLPFTRKGVLTINPDRRIKRGTFIRYKRTSEIFYVDNVSNGYTKNLTGIERTTILNVERGMFEDFIYGKSVLVDPVSGIGPPKLIENVSYFNIIDTEIIKKYIINKIKQRDEEVSKVGIQIKKNFGVNEDIFNFFITKRMLNVE